MSLDTARLALIPCAPEQLLALIEEPGRFEDLVGLPAAEGLRGFFVSDDVSPKWVAALRTAVGPDPWRHGFFVVHRDARCVIGSAGFKGAPDADGVVEIAYGVVPNYEGQGYATEAAAALVTYAFDHGAELVRAHTLPVANASGRVLLKNGFHHAGPVVDPEDGPVWRWERVLGALVLCALLGCSTPSPWVQVWSDEFTGAAGASIDTTKWRYDTADGCAGGNCGWGNNEKEYYSRGAENIALNGQGQLTIVARTTPPPAGLKCYYGPCRYTSAKITTRGKVDVAPGRVEARIKLSAGQGLWPAFWLLGTNMSAVGWPASGELDVMEHRGSAPATMSSAIHGPGYSGNTPFVHARVLERSTFTDSFHTFAVEWDSLTVRFFVDDTVHYVVSRSEVERYGKWAFDQPFFVIVNLAVGGHFDGDPASDAIFPATMLVDYVRVYRRGPARVN